MLHPNILIIDDSPEISEFLSLILKTSFEVNSIISINNNKDALSYCIKHPPDLIISDFNRPGGNGYEFLLDIRKNGNFNNMPVIFVTGFINDKNELLLYRNGASAILLKPINPDEFVKAVKPFIQIKENRDKALIFLEKKLQILIIKKILVWEIKMSLLVYLTINSSPCCARGVERIELCSE